MRLKFNILCFEDNKRYLRPILDRLNNQLLGSGFELNEVDICEDSEKLEEYLGMIKSKKLDVDLILMDFKLARQESGDSLINQIRDHEVFTDIIFYSQDRGFKDKLDKDHPLDGVFFTDRGMLRTKAWKVIQHLIEKRLNLSTFRGLFMAETSELDVLIEEIIKAFFQGEVLGSSEKEDCWAEIFVRVDESLKDKKKVFERIRGRGPGDLTILLSKIDSSIKARTLAGIVKEYLKSAKAPGGADIKRIAIAQELEGFKFDCTEYQKEISGLRNKLAHAKETRNKEGKKILEGNRPGTSFEFTNDNALRARKDLRKYYDGLTGIYRALTGRDWE